MTMLASQITSLTVVYSIVYSGVNRRKHQSSASLAFVWEIHRWPVNFPHKWPVTRKMFPFDDVIMLLIMVVSWRRRDMRTFSALLAFCGESTGGFPYKAPVTRNSDFYFNARLANLLTNNGVSSDLRRSFYVTVALSFSQNRHGCHLTHYCPCYIIQNTTRPADCDVVI